LAKNWQKQKSLLGSMGRKSKPKNRKKGFLIACNEVALIFQQNLSITAKVSGFLTAVKVLL
jgi:hypothetical protein